MAFLILAKACLAIAMRLAISSWMSMSMVYRAPKCRYVGTTRRESTWVGVVVTMTGGTSASKRADRCELASRPRYINTTSVLPFCMLRDKPNRWKVVWSMAITSCTSGWRCSGLAAASGTAKSSTHVIGGTSTPSEACPWQWRELCWSWSRRSWTSFAISRLKPMSANGEPGRVPLRVSVASLLSGCSWNHVLRCTSARHLRSAGGMSLGRCNVALWSSSAKACRSKSMGSKTCRSSSYCMGESSVKMNSRRRWWKAERRSTKITAVDSFRARPKRPWRRSIWMPDVVCWEGNPPSWPNAFRVSMVGKRRRLSHAWYTLP